eukprot:TCALIF_08371-PB protein Name:"Similar to oma1 Metalloendopeptidase OMA1, mitochondrial (Danio rerio)" AED:0.53 eAED:0.54 QI:0/0/0/0.83/0.2/0.33/6/0/362
MLIVCHRRPIWLGLIAFFFSKPFLLPFAKLSMFPLSTLVNEYAGSHWLIGVFAISIWPNRLMAPKPAQVHTSQAKSALPPILVGLVKPIARITAALFGRRVRIWWRKLPDQRRIAVLDKLKKSRMILGGLGAGTTIVLLYQYEAHIETCAITGRKRFLALRPEQIEKIARSEFEQSGNIFVFTGMLDMCETDGQLGFVLSHEIAHTLLNHAGEKISHVNFVYMWVLVPLALLWAVLPNDGIALIADWFFNKVIEIVFELPFSREMEREADEVGLTMAAKACFDVRQASLFWGKMEALESLEGHEKMPEILATHPTHDRRREYLETLVPEALKRREQSGCAQLKDTNVAFQDYWRRFRSLRPA